MTGPYGWDEYWDNPAWSRMVSDYGVNKVVAWSIDSQFPIPNPASRASLTRNVNPDRHARIRQKHFHNAWPALWGWSTDLGLDGDALIRALQVVSSMEDCIEAFDACDWGTQ